MSTISTEVKIPEELHVATQQYLEQHPGWDHERIMQAALSLFLLQNGARQGQVSELYLSSLFGYEA